MAVRQTRIAHIGRAATPQVTPPRTTAAQVVEGLLTLCTVAESATILCCSPRTIRRLISTGRLQALRLVQAQQARVLIPRSSIELLIAQSLGA